MKYAHFDSTVPQPAPVLGWYHVLDATDSDGLEYPHLPPTADLLELTDAQWAVRWSVSYVQDGALVPAPAPTAAEIAEQEWAVYQARAKMALVDTDMTVMRIAEAVALGVTTWTATDVVAWMNYRKALRTILSDLQPATIPTMLPTKPVYPAGT